jgi:hypothetical protein
LNVYIYHPPWPEHAPLRNSLPKAQRRKLKLWKGKLMQMSERYNKHFVSLGLLFHTCHNCKKHPGEKEARRRLKVCQKKGTIERPKGTAGRDFSLQEAMNLDGKDTVFKKIQVSILSLPLYMSSQFFFHEYKSLRLPRPMAFNLIPPFSISPQ